MKKCKKGLHEYRPVKGSKIGCPECLKIHLHKRYEHRKLNPDFLEQKKVNQKRYCERIKACSETKLLTRGRALRARYWPHLSPGEALAEYDRLMVEQDYMCKICEVDQQDYKQFFHVDHCHQTGFVRGLLCSVCNRYLIAGIDMRAKAIKVQITRDAILENIYKYYEYSRKTRGSGNEKV